ncbi:MAG: SDR family NAD(P)-dependent oxidoreductase [bacterium]
MIQAPNPSQPLITRRALITGASEGIGRELAVVMGKKGWELILIARREKLLQELSQELKERFGAISYVFPADLSNDNTSELIAQFISDNQLFPDCLVNNAGFGYYGEFSSHPYSLLKDMIEVNIKSLVLLTHLMLKSMIEKKSGWIVNIASVAGFQPLPSMALYSATKSFVLNFSIAISHELKKTGIKVVCVCPGSTITGFARVASGGKDSRYTPASMSASQVAELTYKAIISGKTLTITGFHNRLSALISRHLPLELSSQIAGYILSRRNRR